jgi:3-oxoacyl-[acyl-carrier protein] reductase
MKSVLAGKNAFITGASGGLGKEISINLAFLGANIFLVAGKNSKAVDDLRDLLRERHPGQKFFSSIFDFSNSLGLEDLGKKSEDILGNIDILINCAGVFPVGSIEEITLQDLENCFQVNLIAPFVLSKYFCSNMKKSKWGRIVNIGSSSAYAGFPNTAAYCASKHALLGFSRSLFHELKHFGVRCISVSPGSIKTEMGKNVIGQDYDTFIEPKDLAETIGNLITVDGNMILEEVRINRMFVQ